MEGKERCDVLQDSTGALKGPPRAAIETVLQFPRCKRQIRAQSALGMEYPPVYPGL